MMSLNIHFLLHCLHMNLKLHLYYMSLTYHQIENCLCELFLLPDLRHLQFLDWMGPLKKMNLSLWPNFCLDSFNHHFPASFLQDPSRT